MEDELTKRKVEHTTKQKQLKQPGQKKVSTSQKKLSGRGKEKDDEQERLKELEASIRSQVAAEERAHKIVEKLVLEDEISVDFLILSGNFITTSHYSDIVEERMIAKKCGYPLCNNQLSQIPSQRYKISMKTNRVYDITERKCFCSNFCFKASKYFESQISDSPVWTRIGESLKTFVLLETGASSSRTGAGDVLLGTDGEEQIVSDESKENCCQTDFDGQPNHIHDEVGESEINKYNITEGNKDLQEKNFESMMSENVNTCDGKDNAVSSSSSSTPNNPESNAGKRQLTSKKEKRQEIRKESLSRDTIVQSVRVIFREWCTHSTLEYLGLSSVKTEAGSSSSEADREKDSFMARAARFFQPANNVKEDSDSDSDSETGASPKISQEDIVINEKSLDKDPVCVLPPIDSKSQRTIRRRIVLDKLFRTLPDLLSEVKLSVGEISRDLTELVHTFSLSNTNVALKPLQWKILASAMIVILQRKNSLVSEALDSSKNEFDALIGRLAITRQDIDQILSPLSSFKRQHPGRCESLEAVETSKSSEIKDDLVPKERENYGEMEELD